MVETLLMRFLCLSFLCLATGAAQADAELQRCAQIAEGTARLGCYDALAAQRKAAPPVAPAATPAPGGQAAAPAPTGEAAFGKPVQVPAAELALIESRINGRFEGWNSKTVFILANGQRWQVSDGSNATVFLNDPKVRVRRAMLGSFFIEFEGTNQSARVRRIQ